MENNMSIKIAMLQNETLDRYMIGVNAREVALTEWAMRNNARMLTVRNHAFESSRLARQTAIFRVFAELWRLPRYSIILPYPGFPFFWSLDSIPQLIRAFFFIFGCKLIGILRHQKVVIDIMDLPRFQHIDLQYPVGLPLRLFALFDKCVYHLATELWVCSAGIAEQIQSEMLWGRMRVKSVENGTFPLPADSLDNADNENARIFVYAGQLNKTRGVPELIDEFCKSKRTDIELRLCGGGGDWIPQYTSDTRIKYLGRLNHEQCAQAVNECDVGIVYQPHGVYYDMVYPTKLALYIGHGKPVITTDNKESARWISLKGVGMSVPSDRISQTIDEMTAESISEYRNNARAMKSDVYWNSIYDVAFAALMNR